MKRVFLGAFALCVLVAATPASAANMSELYSLGTSSFPNIVLTYTTTNTDEATTEAVAETGFRSGVGLEFLFNEHFGVRGMTHYVYDTLGSSDYNVRYNAALVYHF